MRMSQYKVKRNKIKYVVISHLHGDHVFGLPGFIGSLSHFSRKDPLKIFGPVGIKELVETNLRLSESHIGFEIEIVEIDIKVKTEIVSDRTFGISAFPVNHRISTYGYFFEEKLPDRNLKKESITEWGLTIDEIKRIKKGGDLIRDNRTIKNTELVHPMPEPRTYAYCADSRVGGWSHEHLQSVHTLYFESTYLDELKEQAYERGHATAKEAGIFARDLDVKHLIIGHYSSRYRDPLPLREEAAKEFANTIMGYDGLMHRLV